MWVSFVAAVLAVLFVIYIPGAFFLRSLRLSFLKSVLCAPLATIAIYAMLGVLYSILGVPASWMSVFAPILVLAVLAGFLRYTLKRYRVSHSAGKADDGVVRCKSKWNIATLLFYVAFSAVLLWAFWLRYLAEPSFLISGFDAVYHVNLVRSFIEAQDYSMLHTTLYADVSFDNGNGPGFYPAAWHTIAALVMSLLNIDLAVVVNALNYSIGAVIFPSAVFFLMRSLFKEEKTIVLCGGVVALAFYAFPWLVIVRGEQFPQLLSFSLVPLMLGCFVLVLRAIEGRRPLVGLIVVILLGFVSLAASQPNTVFTVGMFAAFVLFVAIPRLFKSGTETQKRRLLVFWARIAFVVVMVVLWGALYAAPFMKSVVSFTWDATMDVRSAIETALLGGFEAPYPQPILALFVLIGFVVLWRKGAAWLSLLYGVVVAMYVVDVSTEGFLKHFLCGFWYTDPNRIAAMCALFGIPLAAVGLGETCAFVGRCVKRATTRKAACLLAQATLVLAFIAANYALQSVTFGRAECPFDAFRHAIAAQNQPDAPNILEQKELSFARKAEALIPEGSVVLNNPDDGSAYLYGLDNLNLYYRREVGHSVESELLRDRLSFLGDDEEIRRVVEQEGISYIILLDHGDGEDKTVFHTYTEDKWKDWNNITEATPGFDLLLHEDDMYLYKIG